MKQASSLPRSFFLFPCYYRCNSTHITENTTQVDYSYCLETTIKNKYQDTLTCPQQGLVLQEAVPPSAFSFLVAESCHFSHPEPHSSAPRSVLQGQPLLFPSGHGAQPTTATEMMAMCGHGSWEQDCSLGSSPWVRLRAQQTRTTPTIILLLLSGICGMVLQELRLVLENSDPLTEG